VFVFLNGKFVPEKKAVISVFDRGFLYGDGLFETIRVLNGIPFRWAQHMGRLQQGAAFLKIKLPFTPAKLRAFADKLIVKNKMPESVLRLSLSRGIGTPGYSPRNASKPTLIISLRPAPNLSRKIPQWNLINSSFRLPSSEPLARFKTANKLSQVLARAEADATHANEALLENTSGFVIEGTSSNLFWIRRNKVYTPPLIAGILPGVTRSVVFEIASNLQIPIHEQNIHPKDLAKTDGIFLSLSSLGIVEAKSLDRKKLKNSPLTTQIARAYTDIVMNCCACNPQLET
jgi:branched-chain amino acid aminotransferase